MDRFKSPGSRRVENEVIFKEQNEIIYQHANNLLPNDDKATFPINFTCECSDESCREPIELTIEQFDRYNKDARRFIVLPSHEQLDIERVIEYGDGFNIVEKYEMRPSTNGVIPYNTEM